MASINSRQTRKQLRQGREGDTSEGVLQGYEDEAGVPREVQGDEQGPWGKVPPFTEDPKIWLPETVIPQTPYLQFPQVDCKQFRLLTAYFTYTVPVADTGQLSIIPEKLALDVNNELQWYTTSLVDVLITAVTPAAPFNLTLGFGSRQFYPAEFRWPAVAIAGAITMRTLLTFEVSDADSFRLNVADLADVANTISALYARSQ